MKISICSLLLPLLSVVFFSVETSACADEVGKFPAPGTRGNSWRTCDWATGRGNATLGLERCEMENVKTYCPVTCGVCSTIAGASEQIQDDGGGDETPWGLIAGCVVGGIALIALIALAAVGKKDERESVDEISRQSSLGLNANDGGVVLSMSGGEIPGPITPIPKHDSIATQDVQKRGTFDSCCDPC